MRFFIALLVFAIVHSIGNIINPCTAGAIVAGAGFTWAYYCGKPKI